MYEILRFIYLQLTFIVIVNSYFLHSAQNRKVIPLTLHNHDIHSTAVDALHCVSAVDFNIIKSATAGSLAGGLRALSRGLTFPFDSMKTFEQAKVSNAKERSIGEYFRGVIPTVVTAIPANALFFITYDYLMAASPCVSSHMSSLELLEQRLLLSAIATIPQNAIKIPAELIKQRAQIQSESDFQLLFQQVTAHRGLAGLYLGSGAMLLREIPYNALQMASFAAFQERAQLYHFPISGPLLSAVLGLFAAAFAALLTQPADVVKTRIMTDLEQEEQVLELGGQGQMETVSAEITVDGQLCSHLKNSTSSLSIDSSCEASGEEAVTTVFVPPPPLSRPSESSPWWARVTVVRHCVEVVREEGPGGLFAGLVPRLLLVSVGGMVYFWAAALADGLFQ